MTDKIVILSYPDVILDQRCHNRISHIKLYFSSQNLKRGGHISRSIFDASTKLVQTELPFVIIVRSIQTCYFVGLAPGLVPEERFFFAMKCLIFVHTYILISMKCTV